MHPAVPAVPVRLVAQVVPAAALVVQAVLVAAAPAAVADTAVALVAVALAAVEVRQLEPSVVVAVSSAVASRASSVVKSSTTCRHRPSVASRFPVARARPFVCLEVRR